MKFQSKDILDLDEKDLSTYFLGTFCKVLFPSESNWNYGYWRSHINTGKSLQITWLNHYNKIQRIPFVAQNLDLTPEESGYYNYENFVYLVNKKPARQYKKAIGQESYSITSFFSQIQPMISPVISHDLKKNFSWSAESLSNLFCSPIKKSFSDLLESVFSEQTLVTALNKHIAVSLGITTDIPNIWFHDTLVGLFVQPTKIQILEDNFTQEMIDFFTPHGISVT